MAAQTAVKHHFLFMLLLGDALFYLLLMTKDKVSNTLNKSS